MSVLPWGAVSVLGFPVFSHGDLLESPGISGGFPIDSSHRLVEGPSKFSSQGDLLGGTLGLVRKVRIAGAHTCMHCIYL